MQFSMYKTSIYNMRSVTISFFNLSVRLFFSFIESDKAKKKEKDLVPKGVLKGIRIIYLKIKRHRFKCAYQTLL